MNDLLPAPLRAKLNRALEQLNHIVLGKETLIQQAMGCLLARGHLLLEDLPGAGKTTLAKAFAATLGLDYRRIQFTSDLLPADVVGYSLLENDGLKFHPGAVFTQLLLADEINRASPKSQSALLEAMEERQVTVERETLPLPTPFFVIATQNPLEQTGTFALPESQLDRFMLRLSLGYPSAAVEVEILRGHRREELLAAATAQLQREDILQLQVAAASVHVSAALGQYVQKLLAASRHSADFAHGLSTRAGLALLRAAQALALIQGEGAVLPEQVQTLFPAVAWHRLGGGGDDGQQAHRLQRLLDSVPVPV